VIKSCKLVHNQETEIETFALYSDNRWVNLLVIVIDIFGPVAALCKSVLLIKVLSIWQYNDISCYVLERLEQISEDQS
jgi:hypothetical protein